MKIQALSTLAAGLLVLSVPVHAQSPEQIEESGNETVQSHSTPSQPAIRGIERLQLLQAGVLLIPDSSNERVMAFDPETGDLIDPDFIPSDSANLTTPIQVILNASQDAFLLSDQVADGVFAYDLEGNPLGIFAPAGGVNNDIMDNIRGINLNPANGNLLVTSASGANAHAIVEFDAAGEFIGNFIDNGEGGMQGPWDIIFRDNDVLVPASTSGAIHRFDFSGNFIADFATINFPEQLEELDNGNVLAGSFSGLGTPGSGVAEYESDGTFVGLYSGVTSNRGVVQLGNGNILTTNGSGVHEIDRAGNLVETKISGVSARFISFVQLDGEGIELPETRPVPTMATLGLAILALLLAGIAVVVLRR